MCANDSKEHYVRDANLESLLHSGRCEGKLSALASRADRGRFLGRTEVLLSLSSVMTVVVMTVVVWASGEMEFLRLRL